ncbi:DUF4255 domain-containing protein [Dickeya dadantii]|uniref:DUF4255 domain-containing protein n=1 Tax=Dickeya dadantii TaxID=204038 RepID=UPI000981D627|nr:DUF4255 domain-containing protein [Dickeya dadantii]MCL6404610.1 DUF4255 domain-containing protein [Dickeya dadantii]NPE57411.1 DUF4255 domain-containing protein [Dickeya dadantii]NPE61258.1 DUF4255 domain-containing protein [Dickeya dadantii]NPE68536.1 DUF4255 domain-containing protein [Dickeya dadantii]NPE72678.1 DUF4255 domain-containing protein [Dickeya dadantii]
MIHASINYLTRQLNQYLKNTLNLHDDVVVIANPADDDGKMFPLAKNKLVVFLSNIEREMLPHRSNAAPPGNRFAVTTPPLFVRVSMVVAANFTGAQYAEGLQVIAHAMAFLHKNAQLNRYNAPDMDEAIEQILLEMDSLPRHELGNMWTMLGIRYLPSAVYRLRVKIADSQAIQSQSEGVRQLHTVVTKDYVTKD